VELELNDRILAIDWDYSVTPEPKEALPPPVMRGRVKAYHVPAFIAKARSSLYEFV
jgi:hypothetical protein